ncbi:hypothetical protein BGLA2_700031 [Burkholderia gladioli]|nr:hypothetical protein BGLA2_700031 [Burkholderia gladioli]
MLKTNLLWPGGASGVRKVCGAQTKMQLTVWPLSTHLKRHRTFHLLATKQRGPEAPHKP